MVAKQAEAVEKAKEIFNSPADEPPKEQLPATISPTDGVSVDGADALVVPPLLKLIQSMSEEAKQGLAKPGEFFFTGDGKVLGGKATVVPMMMKREWVEFDDEFKRVRGTTRMQEAAEWWGDDAFRYDGFAILVYIRENEQLAVLRLRSTSKRVAIKILSTAAHKFHISTFAFELYPEAKSKGKTSWFAMAARHVGHSTDAEKKLAAFSIKSFGALFNSKMDDAPEAESESAPF